MALVIHIPNDAPILMKMDSVLSLPTFFLLLAQGAVGQSTFEIANISGGVDAPVFDAQGTPLAGADYLAELYGGTTPDSLTPAMTFGFPQRIMAPFFTGSGAGYFRGPSASIFSAPPGGWAWLQVRSWDARLGSTYEQVAALGIGGYGESSLFYAQGGNPFDQFPFPAPLVGLQSFSLRPVVPEPSTWALLAFGGTALWWGLRRRPPGRV